MTEIKKDRTRIRARSINSSVNIILYKGIIQQPLLVLLQPLPFLLVQLFQQESQT